MSEWEVVLKSAKNLESKLEIKVQKYSSLAQKINADFSCDEESPLVESIEEQQLAADIEQELQELAECISSMRKLQLSTSSVPQQEVLIRRYYEIHFDYSNEFKTTAASVQRKRENSDIFQRNGVHNGPDSSTSKLLRERSSIAASIKSVNDVFREALEVRTALSNQRNILGGSGSSLSNLVGILNRNRLEFNVALTFYVAANVPSFHRLIDGIQKKNTRESMTIALVIAGLIIFCIWWIFLR